VVAVAAVVVAEVVAEDQEAAAVQEHKAMMDKGPDTELMALQVA
tara:strand:- start:402 stop:533 length:132 start_codon:yes stop_codon:yes gene_type:complete